MTERTDFLYPFIEADERDAGALLIDLAESARGKAAASAELRRVTLEQSATAVGAAAAAMTDRFARGGRLFVFGGANSKKYFEMDEARNDTIYLRLITGGATTEQMQKEVTDLLTRKPNMLAYRTTGALYELRRGNAAGATKLYDGWKVDWTTASERFKVVRVAALTADGRKSEAEELLATIDRKKLRPEEVALLDGK